MAINQLSGLNSKEAIQTLTAYKPRFEKEWTHLAGGVAGTAMIVSVFASVFIGTFLMMRGAVWEPVIRVFPYGDKQLYAHALVNKNPISLLFVVFDALGMLFSPFAIGGIVYCLFRFYIEQHSDHLEKLKEELKRKYESKSIWDSKDIIQILDAVDSTERIKLIAKMNFFQLYTAYKCVNEKTFSEAIKDVQNEDACLWRGILRLKKSNPTPQQLRAYMRTPQMSAILDKRMDVWAAIHFVFSESPELSRELYNYSYKSVDVPKGTIEIKCGANSKRYDAQELLPRCGFLNAKKNLSGSYEKVELFHQPDDNVFTYFDFLAGKFTIKTKDDAIKLLPHTHYFLDTRTLKMIEAILMLNESFLMDDDHVEIVSNFFKPETNYYKHLETRLLEKARIGGIENLDLFIEQALRLGSKPLLAAAGIDLKNVQFKI